MITKEEFLKRLKEDKFHKNPQQQIDYRLPVVQYYLTNYTNSVSVVNGTITNSNLINIKYLPEDFILVNQAFDSIKKLLIK